MPNEIRRTSDGQFHAAVGLQDGTEGLGSYSTLEDAQDAIIAAEWAYNNTKLPACSLTIKGNWFQANVP
jgi:hypothetical protein